MSISKYLDPKNDFAFKKIFGTEKNKGILIHFINDIIDFKGRKIQEVTFLKTIQDPEIAGSKQSIVDILCKDEQGDRYIVEMQITEHKGFEKRAQYYAAKAYSSQMGSKGKYKDLKEIIFLAISNFVLFKDKKAYKSDHVILDKETYEHDLKDFSFTFLELPKFKKTKISELENMIEKWCYFFKNADKTREEDLEKLVGSDVVIKEAYHELDKYYWTEAELNTYEKMEKTIKDNAAVLEFQLEKATTEGFNKGREEGIVQGIEKGIEKGKLEIAINMLSQGFDIVTIEKLTGLSKQEIEELKKN